MLQKNTYISSKKQFLSYVTGVKIADFYVSLVRNGIFNFRSDEKEYPFYYRNEIEVFDWNGEITLKYIMDKPFSDFVVSSDDTTIYTLSQDVNTKEPQVVVYRLK